MVNTISKHTKLYETQGLKIQLSIHEKAKSSGVHKPPSPKNTNTYDSFYALNRIRIYATQNKNHELSIYIEGS